MRCIILYIMCVVCIALDEMIVSRGSMPTLT